MFRLKIKNNIKFRKKSLANLDRLREIIEILTVFQEFYIWTSSVFHILNEWITAALRKHKK